MPTDKENDGEQRQKDFLAQYGELTKKYDCDFVSFPVFEPNEKGTFDIKMRTQIVDKRQMLTKSPFIP